MFIMGAGAGSSRESPRKEGPEQTHRRHNRCGERAAGAERQRVIWLTTLDGATRAHDQVGQGNLGQGMGGKELAAGRADGSRPQRSQTWKGRGCGTGGWQSWPEKGRDPG
ncbi:hypothetical protein LBMAG56_37270 [Verrucomicrobiota bacterium]|nr:hypothetical protein LBMAG56_37270 [Verrucomicrobiota bacterium]